MAPQRLLGPAAVACAAGAGLALYAATRTWSVRLTPRPGLTELRAAHTGAEQMPWLVALAVVALAGAGALLATRGVARRLLGGLLATIGVGLAAVAVAGRATLDPGAAGAAATLGPAACVLGGALVAVGGWWAARHGHTWPAMGARYERGTAPRRSRGPQQPSTEPEQQGPGSEPPSAQRQPRPVEPQRGEAPPVDTRAAWDALDRGDDPTT
ncbi:Trp biosynthesis-associated membrane protein [Krasilnikovia sp. M28-CT-15]|uniref:Trp biosynthesis-associated membrane protein n=1 Tax=Krasilnikovia sp. M28-CT-15 TaxID=3373540 RepID=UPI00387678AC